MNKPYILWNLKEARESLDQLITDLQARADYDFGEFRVDGTVSSSKRLFLRPIDPDLIALIDADGLDSARAQDFVLRIGSLTFEVSR